LLQNGYNQNILRSLIGILQHSLKGGTMKSKHCSKATTLLTALMIAVSASAANSKIMSSQTKSKPFSVQTVQKSSLPNVSPDILPNILIDDAVVQFLGRQCIEVLLAADAVETYQIDWRKRSDQKAKYIHGYPVIAKGRNLEAMEIQIVRALVAQGTSYDFIVSKRTRMRPAYMLRFIKNSAVADIILDLQSSQWGFYFKDDLMQEDITENLAGPVLMMIFRAVFGH